MLLPLALKQYGSGAEHLLVHPPQERIVELDQLLSRYMGQNRAALALDHQIPHGGNRFHAAAFIRNLGVVRDEMKLSPAVAEAALLDLMAAHKKTHWIIDTGI